MWKRGALALGAVALITACGPRVRGGFYGGPRGIHLSTNENVHEKRREWFQGLYHDCVHRHFANACFKTGRNIEDGVVAKPSTEDAFWFYAKACDLQPNDEHCSAAERTDPEMIEAPGDHTHDEHHDHEHAHPHADGSR